jgi:hypothetical protein
MLLLIHSFLIKTNLFLTAVDFERSLQSQEALSQLRVAKRRVLLNYLSLDELLKLLK